MTGSSENENDSDSVLQTSTSFMGTFPTDCPRYAIGLFIERKFAPVPSSREVMEKMVNPLAEWLAKH